MKDEIEKLLWWVGDSAKLLRENGPHEHADKLEEAAALIRQLQSELTSLRTREEWQPIETLPEHPQRVLFLWEAFHGVEEHVELGWRRGDVFCNTYGKAFSGKPDYWMALPKLTRPTANEGEK